MADGLARQIAGLTGDIRNLGKRIPSYQRGVVANVSPPTVIMDRDVTATPRPVADVLVPGLAVGQRVEVRVIGSRRVITSIHPADSGSYVVLTGAVEHGDLAANSGSQNLVVVFPRPFAATPRITATPFNPRVNLGMQGQSPNGFTIRAFNWTGSIAVAGFIQWHAIAETG